MKCDAPLNFQQIEQTETDSHSKAERGEGQM